LGNAKETACGYCAVEVVLLRPILPRRRFLRERTRSTHRLFLLAHTASSSPAVAPSHSQQCLLRLSTSTAHVRRVPCNPLKRFPSSPSNEADHSLQRRAPRPQTSLSRRLPRTRSLSSPTRSTPSPSKLLLSMTEHLPALRFLCRGEVPPRRKRPYGPSQLPQHSPSTRQRSSRSRTSNGQRRNASQSTSARSKRALSARRRPVRAVHAAWLN